MAHSTTTTITEASFLDKTGKNIKVKDVISTEDCWQTKEGVMVLSHRAMKKIATIAGISKNYKVEESSIQPDYKNGMEHIVRVTIKCNANVHDALYATEACVHCEENTLTVTGEANRENTSQRGKGYLRKMAEKRAYDIAVLEHLGLHSTIFSEDESETFKREPVVQEQSINILNTDIEHVRNEINELLKAKTSEELSIAWKKVEEKQKTQEITQPQKNFLINVYEKQSKLIAQLTKK